MEEIKKHIYSDLEVTDDLMYAMFVYYYMRDTYAKNGTTEFTPEMIYQSGLTQLQGYAKAFADGKLDVYADILCSKLGLIDSDSEDYRVSKMYYHFKSNSRIFFKR